MPEIPLGTVVGPQGPPGPKGDTGTFSPEDLQRISDLETGKVDKVSGKGLSTNDYTNAEKNAVDTIGNKVDKVAGKGLSTNDYTDADKNAVATIGNKVDKVSGKGLSTNDYTTADKNKLSGMEAEANKTLIDTTLSNAGQAADAKATGDAIAFLCEYLKSMDIYRTASGNPATFSDAKAANVKDLLVTMTPTQSGSGDPSPDNVRPISGVTSVSVTRTGQNGANSQTVTVQLTDGSNPLTVYGGTLDVTTGLLTVTDVCISCADYNFRLYSTSNDGLWQNHLSTTVPGAISRDGGGRALSNVIHSFGSYSGATIDHPHAQLAESTTVGSCFVAIPVGYSINDVQLYYPLSAPVTYQLTPQQLATLAGYNSVTTDAGTVSVTYKADTSIIWGGG